jgi:hypothetical protein
MTILEHDPAAEDSKTERKLFDTDTAYKAVSFIETYTGRAFYPLRPEPSVFTVMDIAHALSNQCRYSGHTKRFFSTAQHCCLLAVYASEKGASPLDCAQVLMHDAPEAYLVDIPRPVKQFMPEYRKWDHDIDQALRQWLGWENLPRPDFLDDLDSRCIVDERAALMSKSGLDWGHDFTKLGLKIMPWTPQQAEECFLKLWANYMSAASGRLVYLDYNWGVPSTLKVTQPVSSDHPFVEDVIAVDMLGGVAKVAIREQRDREAGIFPAPEFEFRHGTFQLTDLTTA